MAKLRKNLARSVCLLICLITLAGYFPVQEADAGAGDLQVYWKWTRADTITDISMANLNQYTRMLIMYEDNGQQYVFGTSFDTGSVTCAGYHSEKPFKGYSTLLNSDTQCYFTKNENSKNYKPVSSKPGYEEYGSTAYRARAFVANTLSEAQTIDGNIQYGASSFVTLEDVSCLHLSMQSAETNGSYNWLRFRLYAQYYGAEQQIVSDKYWKQSLDYFTKDDEDPEYGWGEDSVWKVWEFNCVPNTGKGRIYSFWREEDLTGFCPTWNCSGEYVFSEFVNLDRYSVLSRAFKFYVYFGSAGEFTSLNDYTIKTGSVVNIAEGEAAFVMDRLTIEPGGVLTVDGILVNNGRILNYGTLMIRDGGTISGSIYSKNKDAGGQLTCYGGSSVYSPTSSPGEGGLIIEKNGRIVMEAPLILVCGSTVVNNGEMILPKGIECKNGSSDFLLRCDGRVWLGYRFDNQGFGMMEKLSSAASRKKLSRGDFFRLSIYFPFYGYLIKAGNRVMPDGLHLKYEENANANQIYSYKNTYSYEKDYA